MTMTVHVIGAGGRSGAALCRALLAQGKDVVPVVRDRNRYQAGSGLSSGRQGPGGGTLHEPHIADLTGPPDDLRLALLDASVVVCTAHARNIPAVLAAAPAQARIVALGSTRKFTRWPDAHGNGVLAGGLALLTSGRNGVILHPTMIYGAEGEDNVQRLATLLRYLPVVPLPGGGRSLVQPIHQSDVTACLLAAIDKDWNGAHSLVIAGAAPVTYRDFVHLVARAAGMRMPPVISIPAGPLIAAAAVLRLIPGLPDIGPAEIRRLLEDKAFSIGPMVSTLGVVPVSLETGLARLFGEN
ncbi:SDR family oxidoreductase [Acetobacter fallax]|uniref:NADH-ubiquinone oxidoreductase n=1 Tax=Acetobacter fallax TaxID=1737473 RepID=A0ABX0K8R3_9PROT|nr:NADH-ubiquinone oxidoreductase [Acetobacter fallax]NHO32782.1 NADH-ubiquinone oxidoreductase [Acetobacter fallax]NHO36345.1 NADH-ubiquinone oxidoreductase [Acetobacter fallax]